jgi:hypothetical protein
MKSNTITANSVNDRMIKLFFMFVFYQFFLHAYVALASHDPRLLIPHVIAYLHDIALLGIVAAIGYLAAAIAPTGLRQTVANIGSVCISIVGILLAIYPKILREYLVFPVNIFEADSGSAKVLISDYMGITAFLPALIAIILVVIVMFIPLKIKISTTVKLKFDTYKS